MLHGGRSPGFLHGLHSLLGMGGVHPYCQVRVEIQATHLVFIDTTLLERGEGTSLPAYKDGDLGSLFDIANTVGRGRNVMLPLGRGVSCG